MIRGTLALTLLCGCVPIGPVSPLSQAEREDAPSPTLTSLGTTGLPQQPMPRTLRPNEPEAWKVEVVDSRDRSDARAVHRLIYAAADRDHELDAPLLAEVEGLLYRLSHGPPELGAWPLPVMAAVWTETEQRLLVLSWAASPTGHPHCSSGESRLFISLERPTPDAPLEPVTQWELLVDEGPLILGDGRFVYTSERPRGERVDASGERERLVLSDEPAVLLFDPGLGVRIIATLDLRHLVLDDHERLWGVSGYGHRVWLIGLRLDGEPFFRAKIGRPYGTTPQPGPEGPCIELSSRHEPVLTCFDLDGRRRASGGAGS